MSTDLSPFHFDNDRPGFEELGQPNGTTHWSEEILRHALGYKSEPGFEKALRRAQRACLTLDIPCEDHFVRQPDGKYLFTRFGCFLISLNGDPGKPEVAAAQAYFAALADTFRTHIEAADGIDRLVTRDEITDGQKSLASTAKRHGVETYAFFQNQGYVGMYCMSLKQLEAVKGVRKGEKLIDRMGKEEMAAHLFRITQTDAKIKRESLRGQDALEQAAFAVGRKVRTTMIELSGTPPERIPLAENIKQVRKKVKGASKNLKSLDSKRSAKRLPPPAAN
jgi:DNA-damage-inducible protein D